MVRRYALLHIATLCTTSVMIFSLICWYHHGTFAGGCTTCLQGDARHVLCYCESVVDGGSRRTTAVSHALAQHKSHHYSLYNDSSPRCFSFVGISDYSRPFGQCDTSWLFRDEEEGFWWAIPKKWPTIPPFPRIRQFPKQISNSHFQFPILPLRCIPDPGWMKAAIWEFGNGLAKIPQTSVNSLKTKRTVLSLLSSLGHAS